MPPTEAVAGLRALMQGRVRRISVAAAALLSLWWMPAQADPEQMPAQAPTMAVATVPSPAMPPASAPAPSASWRQLSRQQQQALAPLAGHWDQLTDLHKRKWLALSRNFHQLPLAQQQVLHSRMAEWAALTPQQRVHARLNFAAASQKLSSADKQVQWEAYQALSEDEKRRLIRRSAKPVGAALATKPAPERLTPVRALVRNGQPAPKIVTDPQQINRHTLLPKRVARKSHT